MRLWRGIFLTGSLLLALGSHAAATEVSNPAPLYKNLYFNGHKVMAHAVVRSGADGRPARVVVANPAGNTGLGFWTHPTARGQGELVAEGPLRQVVSAGVRGVELNLKGPAQVTIDRLFLDSVRTLRDADHDEEAARQHTVDDAYQAISAWGPQADSITEAARQTLLTRLQHWFNPERVVDPARPKAVILERRALGSGARYRVEFIPHDDTVIEGDGTNIRLSSARGQTHFEVRTFIGRSPLVPIGDLGGGDIGRSLGFLSTNEKLLAGSWQYLTYFGRDSLISAALASEGPSAAGSKPILGTAVRSVLDRISPNGEVAHEEDIGDQATLLNLTKLTSRIRQAGRGGRVTVTADTIAALEDPVYDYKMIDGEYLLPPILNTFASQLDARSAEDRKLLDETFNSARLQAVSRLLVRIDDQTALRSGRPKLISLRPGEQVGNWRDSNEGLGGGRTPLDVNAYLVPSALHSLAELMKSPNFPKEKLLELAGKDRTRIAALLEPSALQERAKAWHAAATKAFDVHVEESDARTRLASLMKQLPPEDQGVLNGQRLFGSSDTVESVLAGRSRALNGGVGFSAISLDTDGRPVPVLSTDGAFDLFYGTPTREEILSQVRTVFQPYPIGLATPVGLVVANAVYSPRPGDQTTFARDKYHGAVVWGWQQHMMRKGLERQLALFKGDAEVEGTLHEALGVMKKAERNVGAFGATAELWSWKAEQGKIVVVPYGASENDATEANDRQLWSLAGAFRAKPKAGKPTH